MKDADASEFNKNVNINYSLTSAYVGTSYCDKIFILVVKLEEHLTLWHFCGKLP